MIWMTPPRGAGCYRTVGAALPPSRVQEDLHDRYKQAARTLVEKGKVRVDLVRLAKWGKVRPCQSQKTN